jgi:DNA-binding CsgD family transcriptional regulator
MDKLTSTDGFRLLAALTELYSITSIEEFPIRVLSVVHRVIGCDEASYNEVELSTGHFRAAVDPKESTESQVALLFASFVHEHPVIAHFASTGDPQAHTISDFLRPAEFHRLGLYGEFFGPLGIEDQLSTTLPVGRGDRVIGVALNRSGFFTEVDRQLLDALRPHLITARQNAVRFSTLVTDPQFAIEAAATMDRLTGRQRDVLRLITTGSTTFQVARELDVSVATVRKHVENIFTRVGVETRLQAARIFLAAHLTQATDSHWDVVVHANHQLGSR